MGGRKKTPQGDSTHKGVASRIAERKLGERRGGKRARLLSSIMSCRRGDKLFRSDGVISKTVEGEKKERGTRIAS